jgi:hypothetical protein
MGKLKKRGQMNTILTFEDLYEESLGALEVLVAQLITNNLALMEAMQVAVEAAHAPAVLPARGD